MRTAAVLPIKSFSWAKSRTALDDPRRAALAEAMAADVLAALRLVERIDEVLVVTRDPAAARAGAAAGATVVDDPHEAGHDAAAAIGAAEAVRRGAGRLLLVPGDCPGLDPAELDALLAQPPGGVTIVADRHGTGTNALVLTPPDVMAPSFGPGSFARHTAIARAAGVPVRVADVPSLAFDVDTREDLAELRVAGPRTRALLGALAA